MLARLQPDICNLCPHKYSSMFKLLSNLPKSTMMGCALLLALVGCVETENKQDEFWLFKGPIMGTQYTITVVLNQGVDIKSAASSSRHELERGVIQVLQTTNNIMSHYVNDSELSQLNREPPNTAVVVSPELMNILATSQRISEQSDGAFDVTLAPAIDAWGFGSAGEISERPSSESLESLRQRIGYKKYVVADNNVVKLAQGLTFNLSAIAKGFAVDQVSSYLTEHGFGNHLVDIGGELRASGKNPQHKDWRIGIEKPHILGGLRDVIELSNRAVATSGDYRNFVELNGQRFSHTIDSKSLSPVLHRLASISVVHESATEADALATAILAMGEVRGIEFARESNLSFYAMIREADDEYSVVMSDDLHPLLYDKGL